MLLRSSSTPLLGSLLSESPSNLHQHHHSELTPNSIHHSYCKISCSRQSGYQNFNKILYPTNSSISPSVSELSHGTTQSGSNGFRRAQSEGNLEGLAEQVDEFSLSNPPKTIPRVPHKPFLETIPSFSYHNSRELHSDDESEEDEFDYITRQYSLGTNGLKEEMSYVSQTPNLGMVQGEEMYLARGLGVANIGCLDDGETYGGCGIGGGGGYRPVRDGGGGGGDSQGLHIEEHYKNMLEESPGNPLFLRNYANFLYQTKKDLKGAEEYYSRSILADPSDGDVLSQYAKLIWELHRDSDRATSYFERAVQAASGDSHIHAAYASFLWEIEDEDEDEDENDELHVAPMVRTMAAAL